MGQQWMCVPPKKGGRPCQGKSVRTHPCNTQPCPGNAAKNKKSLKNKNNTTLKPIVKSMPFSRRPQNYIKCVIKEYDVFYTTENPSITKKELSNMHPDLRKGKAFIKRPARIIMNTNTISIFNDDNFKNAVFTFNLKRTEIAPQKKEKCCFDLQSGKQQYTICGGFGQPCAGSTKGETFVSAWVKDFNLFKTGCFQNLKIKMWKNNMAKKAIKDAMGAAGLGGLNDRANLIKKKVQEKSMGEFNKKMQNTENTAMKAMKREFDIEKMLQAELQLKADLESKGLLNLKKREQKKKRMFTKSLKK